MRDNEIVVTDRIGPAVEITDEQRMKEEGGDFNMKDYDATHPFVKDVKDGDVFRFEYEVGSSGCQLAFEKFYFTVTWQKSEAILKEEAEEAGAKK